MSQSKDGHADIVTQIQALLNEVYRRGYSAGIDAIVQSAMQNNAADANSSMPLPKMKKTGQSSGYREGTTIATVHGYIKDHPGQTGSEIFKALALIHEIEERTVRTSLNRLKTKWGGLIVNREGKWYPKEHALRL